MQIHDLTSDCYQFSMKLKIRIRELRQSRGWTLDDMAPKVGISVPHLSEVERGKKNLNNHLIERIASVLNVKSADIISDELPEDLAEVNEAYESLSQRRQTQLLEFARFLRAQQDTEDTPAESDGELS